jgi:hypothetical protein
MESSLSPTFIFPLFRAATFKAAVVAGVAGFAFGVIAAALRLFFLTPLQTATLIAASGLIVPAGQTVTGGEIAESDPRQCRIIYGRAERGVFGISRHAGEGDRR